jgi:hypothetical protein
MERMRNWIGMEWTRSAIAMAVGSAMAIVIIKVMGNGDRKGLASTEGERV